MFVGIDAGGTSTRAIVLDQSGRCTGYGVAGGGNPVSWGPVQAGRAVRAAVSAALKQSNVSDPGNSPVLLAMAGSSAYFAPGAIASELRPLGLTGSVAVESDLLATYCSGTYRDDGYALVAGTGAAAVRVRARGVEASADGLGWLLGDDGSGFWLGHHAVRAAFAGVDGRGPATALTEMVFDQLDLPGRGQPDKLAREAVVRNAIDGLYYRRPVELAQFAGLVFDAAHDDDAVAVDILDRARRHLASTIGAVYRNDMPGPVVLGGGVANRLPGLSDAIVGAFAAATGAESLVNTPTFASVQDGTVGSGVLALRHFGHEVDEDVFQRLAASVAESRAAAAPSAPSG